MRIALLLTFALALSAVAAPVPKPLKKADDLTVLEGRWEGVTVDTGSGPSNGGSYWFEVKDGKLSTGIGTTPGYVARTLRIDATTTPKQIDVDDTRGGFHLGIFEIDGDTIRWCESSSTTNRPPEFKAVNGFNLLIYRRAKDK